MAHIIAVLRLSGGSVIRDICVHPASPAAMDSGANVLVVEAGAIPRDADFSEENWAGTGMEQAAALLRNGGYAVSLPEKKAPAKKCPCSGNNLEKYLQPILLHILSKEPCNGYTARKQIANYATYSDTIPDMAATYRYLKVMADRGMLSCTDGVYSLTAEGIRCLETWKQTIREYTQTLLVLEKQLDM